MRILHLNHLYHPSVGGLPIYMKQLSEKLVEFNDEVLLYTSMALDVPQFFNEDSKRNKILKKEIINGVKVRRFPVRYKLYERVFKKIRKMRGGYRITEKLFGDALENIHRGPFIPGLVGGILSARADIVVCPNVYNTHSYMCYLARKWGNFPFVIIPSLRMEPGWQDDVMVDRILKEADGIIAFTEHEKNILLSKGIKEEIVSVVGNAIIPEEFEHVNGSRFREKYQLKKMPTVTFLGRKTRGKGSATLIDAMNIVWQELKDVRLVLAGYKRDEYVEVFAEKIKGLKREDQQKILDLDQFPSHERGDIYADMDVFVMASQVDSFGLVYLEAWCCGKPVIACKNTAPGSYITNGQNGLLVEYGNSKELAAAILRLLRDENLRRGMGEDGRKQVLENYTWDVVAKQIRQAYQHAIERHHAKGKVAK